jgi:hypothetical protein
VLKNTCPSCGFKWWRLLFPFFQEEEEVA